MQHSCWERCRCLEPAWWALWCYMLSCSNQLMQPQLCQVYLMCMHSMHLLFMHKWCAQQKQLQWFRLVQATSWFWKSAQLMLLTY
jgi:hypothetical protein